MRTIRKLVIHHTAGGASETIHSVDKLHQETNWGNKAQLVYAQKSSLGWYIQYHYFIDRDGVVTQTRKESEIGWHAGSYAVNQESIGICVQGNFDKKLPSVEQTKSLEKLIVELKTKYKVSIHPHREFTNTHCYGLKLSNYWAKQFMRPITVMIIGKKEFDVTPIKDWFRDRGLYNLYFDFEESDLKPQWTNYTTDGNRYIDERWFDNNLAHLGGKSDIVVYLTEHWEATPGIRGYAKPEQRLGQWRCYVNDNKETMTTSTLPIQDYTLRTIAHEICHLLYPACGYEDLTHELDYSNQSDKLLKDIDFSRFKHFVPEDGVRFFYVSDGKIEERIIYSSIAKLFASGYNYWRRVFGFTDTIPKL